MSMTKQQKLGACFGGAVGVVALALGWFLYSAYAEHQAAVEGDPEEGLEGLVGAKEKNAGYYATSNPFPSAEAIALVKSNEAAYAAWKADALDLASRGDCPPVPPRLGGTVFKNRLFEQVSRAHVPVRLRPVSRRVGRNAGEGGSPEALRAAGHDHERGGHPREEWRA